MMRPSENEGDAKKAGIQPEPLCLFCFPDEVAQVPGKTYVATFTEPSPEGRAGAEEGFRKRQKEKEEFWLRKRTEARIRRRRMKEPIRNLKSYLLSSVKNEKSAAKNNLPTLFEVLETVKDAWPSPSRGKSLFRNENEEQEKQSKMKNEQLKVEFPSQLLSRRLSVPEELMRRYSISKEKTSEESETNKTAFDISPSSSSTLETARQIEIEKVKVPPKLEHVTTDACQQTSDSERKTKKLPQRVTQSDYYKQGKRIIKVRGEEKGTCTCQREVSSSTTVSAKDETDDSGTTDSLLSSSPTQLPKRESSSGNLSSESDNIRCTCTELSSKETSTDLYLSGKSTLSQTVSDKSISTQDSTVSVNSVSSRGSTVSDNSNSTTPEMERTSAKETTTSTDYSPRTPRNRKNRRRDKHSGCSQRCDMCPKHSRNRLRVMGGDRCPIHSENNSQETKATANVATNTDNYEETQQPTETDRNQQQEVQSSKPEERTAPEERYKWAKLSQEELYMMQQLRHRKLVESQKFSTALPPDKDSISACGTGSTYQETECMQQTIMIPRYSALPRSLSMLVNTSSPDTSHNSDSDNQSLADSLEDQPVTHKLYFDTKKESKPVRGDASVFANNKLVHKQPRGRAFFVSIKEPYGEDEMLEKIEKIPQPPEKIKNKIFKRHLSLCTKHKHRHPDEQKEKKNTSQKTKKNKNKHDGSETVKGKKKTQEECKKAERRNAAEKPKRVDDEKTKDGTETGSMRKKDTKPGSKIPVLVTSRSTSSSPEPEVKEKLTRPKIRLRREKEVDVSSPQTEMETTQILEITHTGSELSLQKPQAVIHPSQVPLELKPEPSLIIPPLVSTLRIPPFRQTWNKPVLAPVRRSPIGSKFRQRFEVIPEEKSSSLSSAEEKNGPKFADASTSPVPGDKIHFQSYNMNEVSNLIVAKFTNKQIETLPYVNNNNHNNSSDNQKIILFSSKPTNSNSSKGRDALIAMNREDFNRLAKGWMNFYKINENVDISETEIKLNKPEDKSEKLKTDPKEKMENHEIKTRMPLELNENIRLDCSNTILRTSKDTQTESSRSLYRKNSLPELPVKQSSEIHKALSSIRKHVEDDDTDSDSTDYMEPPSPRVPPLPIDDIPSDGTPSSSDSDPEPKPAEITTQYICSKRRSNRLRQKDKPLGTLRCGKKKNSGWSVTVAGTVELSRSAPDLEMRLSFPATGTPPVVCHSDSGFADDSNYSKLSESLQELDLYTSRKELPLGEGNMKQKWMVTVKNPITGEDEKKEVSSKSKQNLPELEPMQSRSSKKSFKDFKMEEKVKRLVERKMRSIWPKVQKVIKKEFLTDSGRLITELDEIIDESCLSVRGNAVSMERKQKPPTMTERDVTRRYTSRNNDQTSEN